MGKNTRYDRLTDRIRRQYSRTKTYEVDLAAGETLTLFDIDDHNFVGNDNFLESGPFNFVAVIPDDGQATIYTRKNREAFVQVRASGPSRVPTTERTGQRYIGFLRIEADETNGFSGRIQVGTEVDTVEFDLLKMSGLLNVEN